MDYMTIFLALVSALVGSVMGGLMSMLGVLLSNWLQWRSEVRREKRQRLIKRLEQMRTYLSQTVSIAAQSPILEDLEEISSAESRKIFMKLWFEIYHLRTLFYEKEELQEKLKNFDKAFIEVLGQEEQIENLQAMAAEVSFEMDKIFEQTLEGYDSY